MDVARTTPSLSVRRGFATINLRKQPCRLVPSSGSTPPRGYGFIAPEDGSKDAFVHISAVERAGLNTLGEGQKIRFEIRPGRDGKSSAEELSIVE